MSRERGKDYNYRVSYPLDKEEYKSHLKKLGDVLSEHQSLRTEIVGLHQRSGLPLPNKPYTRSVLQEYSDRAGVVIASKKRKRLIVGVCVVGVLSWLSWQSFSNARMISEALSSVLIPAGSFDMGCAKGDTQCYRSESPLHEVELTHSFYMMKGEVTQGLWKAVMGSNPSVFSSCGDNCPVDNVNWSDVIKFSNLLNDKLGLERCYERSWTKIYDCEGWRLPTEAEWEYAARGGTDFKYAGSNHLDEVGWVNENSRKVHPICYKRANVYGLCDMSGNVFEWVWDWHGQYSSSKQVDPKGPNTGLGRIIRSGSWRGGARFARVSCRGGIDPSYRSDDLGFRLSRSSL